MPAAEVSRIISRMWKGETPEVKAEYERRAEVKKIEHAAMYPNYRYMPKSKELKEELKRAKGKNKVKDKGEDSHALETARPGRYAGSSQDFLPFTSHTFPFLPAESNQYAQGGPSPPMSAADSPSPEPFQTSPPIESAERVNEQAAPIQNVNSHYRPHTAASQNQPTYPMAQHGYQPVAPKPVAASHYRTTSGDAQLDQNGVYYPQPQYQQPQVPQADQAGQNHEQQYAFVQDTTHQGNALSFGGQNLGTWAFQNPEFQPSLDQFLNNTSGDCYQMQINPADQQNLGEAPVGPLEVEVGQLDFGFSLQTWANTPALNMGGYQSFFDNTVGQNGAFENLAGPSSQASAAEGSGLEPDQTFRLDQFINFDPTFDYMPPTPAVEETPEAPAPIPYVPPAGAAHTNKRRVAASWNPSFAMTDPIDV
ncbi:hypothetical protein D9615_002398 [Tricholomella constricta]|uniref:HMG box domain-containing protein n=1 Tax=Tricholomella constricta TaxID=117010 RepID=A0A8H5HMA9_9AGAR|nr:hypothetical protein D9615_002398 [Tricholomella constricta]